MLLFLSLYIKVSRDSILSLEYYISNFIYIYIYIYIYIHIYIYIFLKQIKICSKKVEKNKTDPTWFSIVLGSSDLLNFIVHQFDSLIRFRISILVFFTVNQFAILLCAMVRKTFDNDGCTREVTFQFFETTF